MNTGSSFPNGEIKSQTTDTSFHKIKGSKEYVVILLYASQLNILVALVAKQT